MDDCCCVVECLCFGVYKIRSLFAFIKKKLELGKAESFDLVFHLNFSSIVSEHQVAGFGLVSNQFG